MTRGKKNNKKKTHIKDEKYEEWVNVVQLICCLELTHTVRNNCSVVKGGVTVRYVIPYGDWIHSQEIGKVLSMRPTHHCLVLHDCMHTQ